MSISAIIARAKERKAKRQAKSLTLFPFPRKKPKRHSEWRKWRDKCDRLMSMWVRIRDKRISAYCRICGNRLATLAYHLIPRSKYAVRWDERCVVAACLFCNWGERNNRLDYREKHRAIFGADVYDALELESRRLVKYSVADLKAIADGIQAKLAGGR